MFDHMGIEENQNVDQHVVHRFQQMVQKFDLLFIVV
jgi:hypothetical protein